MITYSLYRHRSDEPYQEQHLKHSVLMTATNDLLQKKYTDNDSSYKLLSYLHNKHHYFFYIIMPLSYNFNYFVCIFIFYLPYEDN